MGSRPIRAAALNAPGSPDVKQRPALAVEEFMLDDPGPREALIRIEAAGVCHSDLSVIDGTRPRPTPMVLGHEASGVVEMVGPECQLSVGQQVVTTFLPRCGACPACATDGRRPCIPGSQANTHGTLLSGDRRLSRNGLPIHHHLGVSAFATHVVVDERSVVTVDSVPPEVACLFGCAVLTGAGAVFNAGLLEGPGTVAIVGLGGVGMAALLAAQSVDGVEVIAVDPVEAKRELAQAWGATASLSPDEAIAAGIQADIAVEAVGAASAFATAIAMTAPGGRTVAVGLPRADATVSFSPLDLVAGARTIVGSYMGSAVPSRDIPKFVDLWRAGRLPVERLISTTVRLDDINHAFDQLASGSVLRQVITSDDPAPL